MTGASTSTQAHPEARGEGRDLFHPAAWLPGPHLQTLAPFLCQARPVPGPHEDHIVRVAADAAVKLRVSRPPGETCGTILLVHGMGGSAESSYMRRTARLTLPAGWTTVRMNCRNWGGTERLSRTLFNAGQSDDVGRVLEALEDTGFPRPFVAVGFSLGGNLVLLYAGTAGAGCRADAVVAFNAPVDLAACATALERPRNRIYRLYFTREMCLHLRRIRRVRPVPGPPAAWRKIRSVRNFDRLFVAPDAGHATAEAYYAAASSGPHLSGIRVPTVLVSAANDPVIPVEIFRPYHDAAPDLLSFVHPSSGGHMGYWQRGRPRFWGGAFLLEWLAGTRLDPRAPLPRPWPGVTDP